MTERFESLCTQYPGVVRREYIAMLHLLGCWRNVFVHRDYRFGLSPAMHRTLVGAASFIREEFAGTDIAPALERFDKRLPPALGDLGVLIASVQRAVRLVDEHLLYLQDGQVYAMALMRYLIAASGDPRSFVQSTWQYGGKRSAGRVHASFLDNGGNHADERGANAPTVTRTELNDLFAFGVNRTRTVFNITR